MKKFEVKNTKGDIDPMNAKNSCRVRRATFRPRTFFLYFTEFKKYDKSARVLV